MSLCDLSDRLATEIPHRADYEMVCARLSDSGVAALFGEIRTRLMPDLNVAGWIPPASWAGTPFSDLFEACGRNIALASNMVGVFVWVVLMNEPDQWYFLRSETMAKSMVYFKAGTRRSPACSLATNPQAIAAV